MGRPKGTKNNMKTPEEKEKLILEWQLSGMKVIDFVNNKKISEKVSLQATTDRKDGLITVNGEVDSEKVSDVTMHAYLIATYSNQGDIVITDEFSGYDFTLDENTSESEISDIAANINNNIRNDGINSIKTAIMKDGSAVMDGLSEGVYLINGDNFTVGNNTYSVTPIIVELIILKMLI